MNVSSVMMDVKHSITKDVHKLRVNLDKKQSEACPNTHGDMPEMGEKKLKVFIVGFISNKTGQKEPQAITQS